MVKSNRFDIKTKDGPRNGGVHAKRNFDRSWRKSQSTLTTYHRYHFASEWRG